MDKAGKRFEPLCTSKAESLCNAHGICSSRECGGSSFMSQFHGFLIYFMKEGAQGFMDWTALSHCVPCEGDMACQERMALFV